MEYGERQVATDLKDIRADHKARYEWAANRLSGNVVDAACGIGYGSWIMAEAGLTVRRFDNDPESIAFARQHWSHELILETYEADATLAQFPDGGYGAVVAFEVLEHLEDPLPALLNFKRMAPRLLASVPNEAVWPHRGRYKFHHRHYTAREFEELLNKAGYEVQSWWGQDGKFGTPTENIQGRTLIVDAIAAEEPKTETFRVLPDVKTGPENVAIVAMGASKDTYASLLSNNGGNRHRLWDEVWAINAMGGVIRADKVIHMDDLRVQELRAEARPDSFVAGMLEWMREIDVPVITCKAYPEDYPTTVEYPLKEVLDEVGTPYLNTTVAYAVALAIAQGVKKMGLYGADFSYPQLHKREKGRGCVEFLLGLAASRGINVELAQNTTLMDANEPSEHVIKDGEAMHPARLYGYDTEKLTLTHSNDGGWTVEREPREHVPTADEMELKYAHVPPEQIQVQKEEGQGAKVAEQQEGAA